MKAIKIIGVLIVVLIVGVVALGSSLPDEVTISRSVQIGVPPATVFGLVSGMRRFNDWSPWKDIDPDTVYTFDGPRFGKGSTMTWASDNKQVGRGRMTVIDAKPYEWVEYKLDFGPNSKATSRFDLEALPEGTRATWTFHTSFHGSLLGRIMGLTMDRMIGPDFERGLRQLAELASTMPRDDFSDLDVQIIVVDPLRVVQVRTTADLDEEALRAAEEEARRQLDRYLDRHRLSGFVSLPARKITRVFDDQANTWTFDYALVLDKGAPEEGIQPEGPVEVAETTTGRVIRCRPVDPRGGVLETLRKAKAYIAVHGFEVGENWWVTSEPVSTEETGEPGGAEAAGGEEVASPPAMVPVYVFPLVEEAPGR